MIEAGIAPSIGTVGDALDNALMESTIGLYKTELIDRHPRTWTGPAEVETATADWVHWFNAERLHSSINYLPPITYEQQYRQSSLPNRGSCVNPRPPAEPGRFNDRWLTAGRDASLSNFVCLPRTGHRRTPGCGRPVCHPERWCATLVAWSPRQDRDGGNGEP